jgi:hypothetical protein
LFEQNACGLKFSLQKQNQMASGREKNLDYDLGRDSLLFRFGFKSFFFGVQTVDFKILVET